MFKPACVLLLLAISFSSCKKFLDYYHYHNNEPANASRITTITHVGPVDDDTTRIFYNNNGLPAALNYQMHNKEFDFIDSFTFYYAYDHLDRLLSETSEFVYGGNLIYYAYEGNSSLPLRDTVRALYVDFVEDLDYDAKGRIIKITQRDFHYLIPQDNTIPNETRVIKYYYDLRGNRQEDMSNGSYPGIIQYTDKPSLYSLHPVWQLIHKNYSRNSVPYGETFNENGLPLSIKENSEPFQPFLNVGHGSKIEYDCGG
jgi:hypothetical protein